MPQTIEHLPNGLTLRQDDRFFKLGQDSVLLAAFARPRRNARVLDLGCGTGALALLVYRPDLTITGLELQQGALDLFRQSIADNGVDMTALQGDLREIRTLLPHGSMDYVICNPPYFDRDAGKSAPAPEKRTRGRMIACTVEDVAVACLVRAAHGRQSGVRVPPRAAVDAARGAVPRAARAQAAALCAPERARRRPARCWPSAAKAAVRKG